MRTYTVHEPSEPIADRMERAEAVVFIRDGFSWRAALLTPFWMIANGMWLALLVYLAVVGAIEAGLWSIGASQRLGGLAMLGLHVLVGFEAGSIRRWHLGRKDYRLIASVGGRNAEACERRFFDDWLKEQPFVAPASLAGGSLSGSPERRRALAPWLRRG